jgi:hypothetical protein
MCLCGCFFKQSWADLWTQPKIVGATLGPAQNLAPLPYMVPMPFFFLVQTEVVPGQLQQPITCLA